MRARPLEYEDSEPQPLRRASDGAKLAHPDASGRTRSYSESLPGLFKRGQGYGEFIDDEGDHASNTEPEALSSDTVCRSSHRDDKGEAGKADFRQAKGLETKSPADSNVERRRSSEDSSSNGKPWSSPQKSAAFPRGGTSKAQAQSRGNAATKTPPLPTKKTKMLSTDTDGSFEALQDSDDLSPNDRATIPSHSADRLTSPFSSKSPAPSRSAEAGPAPGIARSSPSFMSQAARLAASFGQAPYKAMARRKTDDFSLMEERAERGDKAGVSRNATPESDSKGSHVSQGSPVRESPNSSRWYPEATSPGAGTPLLSNSADKSAAQQKAPPQGVSNRQRSASLQPPSSKSPVRKPTLQAASARYSHEGPSTAPPTAAAQEDASAGEAFDIFEPRPSPVASETSVPGGVREFEAESRKPSAHLQTVDDVKSMKGHEALKVLQRGSLLRKKWLDSKDHGEAQQSQKTERLIRCRVEHNKVVLHYYHQGVKGLLAKEEMSTTVQRVEIPDSSWMEGDCIILHTARGLLALAAPNAALHSIWVLGLNAALASCNTRGKDVLLTAPVRAIPRNSMFVVTPVL